MENTPPRDIYENEADFIDIGDEGPRTPDGRFVNVRIRKAAEEAVKEGVVSIRFSGMVLCADGDETNEHKITDPKEIAFFMKAFLNSSRKPGAVLMPPRSSSDTIWVYTKKKSDPDYWPVDSGDVHDYWGPDMVRVYAKYSRPDARHWFKKKK